VGGRRSAFIIANHNIGRVLEETSEINLNENAEVLNMFFTSPIWGIIGVLIFVATFAVDYYYQRKAGLYADEMVKDIPEEWNKRIKANAWRNLISRGIWGLLFLSFIYIIWNVPDSVVWKIFLFLLGIILIIWGVTGFRGEMKKLKDLR
jgi:hypothetical protein